MKTTLSKTTLAAALACGTLPAFAATQVGDYLSFSGFGTLGGVVTDTDQAEFKRDGQAAGADKHGSLDVDSDFGLQLTATATPWLSATVQMLSANRDGKSLTTETEWAFVKVAPLDGLSIRAGRMALPVFAVSDFRNVGYANNWLRAPGEVYALAMLGRLDGGDVTYSLPIGSTTLTVSGLAGKSAVRNPDIAPYQADKVHGLNVQWETDWATFRLGQVRADIHVWDLGIVDSYKFTGAGVMVDRDNIVAQAEYVMRRSEKAGPEIDANGWYMLGGYRFGSLLPYGSYAADKPHVSDYPFHLASQQQTAAVGLRWDALKSLDVKAQLERIDTHGLWGVSFTGPVSKPVTAASLAVDFVF